MNELVKLEIPRDGRTPARTNFGSGCTKAGTSGFCWSEGSSTEGAVALGALDRPASGVKLESVFGIGSWPGKRIRAFTDPARGKKWSARENDTGDPLRDLYRGHGGELLGSADLDRVHNPIYLELDTLEAARETRKFRLVRFRCNGCTFPFHFHRNVYIRCFLPFLSPYNADSRRPFCLHIPGT